MLLISVKLKIYNSCNILTNNNILYFERLCDVL